jgi:hypothetical protein
MAFLGDDRVNDWSIDWIDPTGIQGTDLKGGTILRALKNF